MGGRQTIGPRHVATLNIELITIYLDITNENARIKV